MQLRNTKEIKVIMGGGKEGNQEQKMSNEEK